MRLSTEFGILTEYTAFLAREGTNLSDFNALFLACSNGLKNTRRRHSIRPQFVQPNAESRATKTQRVG